MPILSLGIPFSPNLIHYNMKLLLNISFLLFLFISFACAKNTSETPEATVSKVEHFIVYAGNKSFKAEIDDVNSKIIIPDLKYTSDISDVFCRLKEGFSFAVDPQQWIGSWKQEEVLCVKTSEGEKYNYTVVLPDFKRINKRNYVVGYIPSDYGGYDQRFPEIKWELLTHVNVAFLYIKESGELNDSAVKKHLQEIREKAHKHGVKVLISLRSDESGEFYQAIKNEQSRNNLVKNAIAYAKENNLDGIDIDYENYDKICPELILFVQSLYAKKGRELLQTCAVAPWNPTAQGGYTKSWHNYFDFINVMTYDFTGDWSKEGQHSSYDNTVNGIRMWMNQLSAPVYKLTMGLPFYGYTWDEEVFKNAPTSLSYDQILKAYPNEKVWEKDQVGRTYYNGKNTIEKKCETAKDMGLGGVMIWQILHETDKEEYKLMNSISKGLN